jgi:serine/threonine protein kinase
MMYEFLTGRVPFEGDNWMAVMAGHLQRHPRPIREQRPEVSPELEAVVLTAMRRYPENRYQSAQELLADLNALSPGTPAPPDSAGAPAARPPPAPPAGSSTPGGVRPAVPTFGALRGAGSAPAGRGGVPAPAGGSGGGPYRPPVSAPAPGRFPGTARSRPPSGPPPSRAPGGPASRDLSPEKPIGRLPAPASRRDFWVFVALVAGGFIGLVALILVVTKLAH